jgi:hypothetical protein
MSPFRVETKGLKREQAKAHVSGTMLCQSEQLIHGR